MKFLRTVSTQRLLASIAGLVVAAAAGTAIAVAASGSGPVPAKKPLARALHDALGAKSISGISADVTFTNHLIDASNLQGSSPLLSGATGRIWLSSDHRLRLELQSDNGDAQVVVNNGSFWVYEPASKTVYQGTLPKGAGTGKAKDPASGKPDKLPTVHEIQTDLAKLTKQVNLSGANPSDVAGQAAYTVRVWPKHAGGLLGAGELAWDAATGVPLRFAVYAQNQAAPVLELKATNITYGAVSPSVFAVAPPSGSKVVKVSTPSGSASAADKKTGKTDQHARVHGAAAVAKRVPFTLVAPSKLVGLPRQSVTLLDWAGHPAALVTYGQNLGGIAVIEQKGDANTASPKPRGEQRGLNLPSVSINGATGTELDTALGTMVRFTRGAVAYTVVGSVPAAAADAAARAL
ncbi:MAG: LolA family protein [Solirubrobacteraceae bacterium]